MDSKALAARLSKKYDTRDPFRLADEMGFIVVFAPLVGMRGFQQRIKRQNIIYPNNTFYLLRLFTTSANSCNHWVSVSPHLYLSAVWGDFSQDFTPNSPQALAQHRRPHGGAFLCPGSPANLCIGFRYSVPKSSKAA